MNGFVGKVVIVGSVFTNINSCGSIIRNKIAILDQSSLFTPTSNDFKTYYLMRSSIFVTQQLNAKYTGMTNPLTTCSTTSPCQSISIATTTFTNFGNAKTALTAPLAVSASGKMQYTGLVLDLDGFAGSVSITDSVFTGLGPLYSTCSVANAMQSSPSVGTDKYSKYGTKSLYQIKSVISIVNHDYTVDIVGNTFTECSGTKGSIYLDLNHKSAIRRLLLKGNNFVRNSGYLEASAVYIRARGPSTTSVYTRIPSPSTSAFANYFCSGYLIDNNLFKNNIGCTRYGGGVLKFQCLDNSETSSSANDIIANTALSSSVLASYKSIDFTSHTTRYETT